jgi:penicillin V acylase-like amidase (Ntn superfamily)
MCTRVTYLGPEQTVITARSLDWPASMGTSIWVYPRGLQRNGAAGPDSIEWTAKYGSVTASGYEAATVDGINERGLMASILYLAESQYGTPPKGSDQKLISISAWGQYVLDNFATVDEVVEAMRQETVRPVAVETPDGYPGTVHLAVTDPSGDSAVVEYVGGNQEIHHGREYQVMTNSPIYSEQLALNTYWSDIGGSVMLPGTSRAADRFVRASYYVATAPQSADITEALAAAFGVIRNASAPFGVATEGQPNVSATLWRTVADLKNRLYYFESAQSPFLIWIDLSEIDFAEGTPSRRLALTESSALIEDDQFVSGNAAGWLKPAEPFAFLEA